MKSTSGLTIIEILIMIAVILVICVIVIAAGASERGYKPKEAPAPVESPRFIETKVVDGGFTGNNPVYLITDTKTGQQWLRAFQYGFAQVSPSATTPGVLRCEAEVPR